MDGDVCGTRRQTKSQRGKKITRATITAVTERLKQIRSSTVTSTTQSRWFAIDSPGVLSVGSAPPGDCFNPTVPSPGELEPLHEE